eukprot:scaffold126_cov315-Pavlova_lutheri.AAC.39
MRIDKVRTTPAPAKVHPRPMRRRRRAMRRSKARHPGAWTAHECKTHKLRSPKRTGGPPVQPAARVHAKEALLGLGDEPLGPSARRRRPRRRRPRLASIPRARFWRPGGGARGPKDGRTATCAAHAAIPWDDRPPTKPRQGLATPRRVRVLPAAKSAPAAWPRNRRSRDARGGSSRRPWRRPASKKKTRRPKASGNRA